MTMLETMLLNDIAAEPMQAQAADDGVLVEVHEVRKKYWRDLRRSLWYGVQDVLNALTLRGPALDTLGEAEFWAIDKVSLELRRGDSLGLLGRNGAGKSTLLKMICGQRSLSSGTIVTRGRIVALTELGLGFNPVLTGRENAYINAAVHGFSRKQFDAIIDEIIDFSGIREFIDSAVQTYSTGMRARLGFSVATHLNPDILVVDEVLAVGDLEFRRKCVKHILKYVEGGGSIILVAHDPFLVQSMCNRCIVLDRGSVVFDGSGIDGVNFHFQLGHSDRYSSLAEAAEHALGDAIDEARTTNLPGLPALDATSLMPLSEEARVVVDQVDVIAADGGTLVTGRAARIVLRCRTLEAVDVTWGFTLLDDTLQVAIASGSRGLDGDTMHLVPGANTLVCNLPELTLLPGVYAIRGGIGDAVTLQPLALRGYKDQPFFFTVGAGEVSRSANFQSLQHGLVSMKCNFTS